MDGYQGVASWVVYGWALLNEVWASLFVIDEGAGVVWEKSGGQYVLMSMNLPELSTKGQDIMASIMTMLHNGLVFLAQISTLLPANALPPVGP